MNFANSSSTMYLANSILLGQVGATCCTAKKFISAMTPTLATLLGKAVTPQMVALDASAMSTTPPIPIFSGPVITSIKGAVIMMVDNVDVWCGLCGLMPFGRGSFGLPLGLPNNVTKKVYMHMSTSSGNDTYGARENMTKRRTWQMAPKRIASSRELRRWWAMGMHLLPNLVGLDNMWRALKLWVSHDQIG